MKARWWFPLVVGAVGLGLALGLAEGLVRVAMRLSPQLAELFGDPLAVQIEAHGAHGYRQRPGGALHYPNGSTALANARGWRGPVVDAVRRPGEVRVVLLGGSTTHGWGVNDTETIDASMRRALAIAYPDRPVSVINLGYDGYDSWQDWERWQSDGVALAPDVVVVHSGINDVRNAHWKLDTSPDPRTLIWEPVLIRLRAERAAGRPAWRTRLKHWVVLLRIPSAIRDRLRGRAASKPDATLGETRDRPPYPQAAEQFEANVRRIVADAQQRGIRVLLSTPPSALATLAPETTSEISYWVGTAATTQQVRDTLDAKLRAIAGDGRAGVRYVPLAVPANAFLDDCHLTPAGNRAVGDALAVAVREALASAVPSRTP